MLEEGVLKGVDCCVGIGREGVKGISSYGILVPLLGSPFEGCRNYLEEFFLCPIVGSGGGFDGVNLFEEIFGIVPIVIRKFGYI